MKLGSFNECNESSKSNVGCVLRYAVSKDATLHQFLLSLLNVNSVSTQLRKVNNAWNKGLVQKSKIGATKVTLNISQLIPTKLAQSGEHHTGTQEV